MKLSYLNFLPINCKPLQKGFLNYRMSLTQILHNKNCEYFYQGIKLNFQWGKDSIKNNLVLYISSIILSLEEHFGELTGYGENVEIDTRVVDGGKILYSICTVLDIRNWVLCDAIPVNNDSIVVFLIESTSKGLKFYLTHSWRKPLSYRNQSMDLRSKINGLVSIW